MVIAIAMSGGVDSSVAAHILAARGVSVVGITFLTGFEPDGGDRAVASAKSAAERLGVDHHVLDVRDLFRQRVIDVCAREYAAGRTPNPCAVCNPVLKFGALIDYARTLGADRFATGHYARVVTVGDGGPALARGVDPGKDQSYFLHRVPRERLGFVEFPLGSLTKAQVRAMAAAIGLESAGGPESQDICFAPDDVPMFEVLRGITGVRGRAGNIVSPDGQVLGTHDGIDAFTIGQRRGLRVALGDRAWVTAINPNGDVVLSTNQTDLESNAVFAHDAVINDGVPADGELTCRIRSAQKPVPCRYFRDGPAEFHVELEQIAKAVTPGQASVVYSGDLVLGGGWIR